MVGHTVPLEDLELAATILEPIQNASDPTKKLMGVALAKAAEDAMFLGVRLREFKQGSLRSCILEVRNLSYFTLTWKADVFHESVADAALAQMREEVMKWKTRHAFVNLSFEIEICYRAPNQSKSITLKIN